MKLTYNCPICNKQLKLLRECLLADTRMYEYTCGHVFAKARHTIESQDLDFTSVDGSGKRARNYQEKGVEFILESDFNVIIADQMRLGKTPQALLALRNAFSQRTPTLILVRSANLWQWVREYKIWCSTLPLGIFPITGSSAFIPPGFSAYIVSMDTFARPKILESLKKISFKLIIADEAHSFKNTESNRSQALVDFVAFQNTGESDLRVRFTCNRCKHAWDEQAKQKYDKRIGHTVLAKSSKCPKCSQYCYVNQQQELKKHYNVQIASEDKPCGLVLLTGTPILNRAEEYFVPLNLVAPERFSSLERFRREWLGQDEKGRWSRVKSYRVEEFKKLISDYVLRREKEDVYTDLPELNRIFTMIEPNKDLYAKQYNKILDKLEMKLAEKANPTYWDSADELMELRRICGMMKLTWASDYLESCALDSPAKYAIGIHHETVRDVLFTMLGGEKNCYKLSGLDSAEQKDRIMRSWESSPRQYLIINMLAGGVGMDFHYCDNVLVLERQWNAETERQFEFRFYNPDKSIKTNPTTVEYVLCKDTFESWWYGMIEEKMANVDPLVYNNWDLQKDSTSFRDLMEKTVASRL